MPESWISKRRTDGQAPRKAQSQLYSKAAAPSGLDRVLPAAILLGLLSRVVVLLCSRGSNDMDSWSRFAETIDTIGLWETYRTVQLFNHPPLMGWMAQGLSELALWTGIPFRILFKLPMLAGDVVCLGLLHKIWRVQGPSHHGFEPAQAARLAMAIFCCNPVSILVTAFHGNTDSLCALLGLVAALLVQRERWLLAGLALAGSVNVKIVGLLWAPALFFLCPSVLSSGRFVAGFIAGMLPFLGPLWNCPEAFYRNAIAYNSLTDLWGVNVVSIKLWDVAPAIAQRAYAYREWGRFLIIGAIIVAAIWARHRRLNALQSATISMTLFLVLTPGFGVQYLVWVVPVLAGVSLLRSLFYSLSAGGFIGWIYDSYLTEEFPLRSEHQGFIQDPIWVLGVVAWLVLAATLATLLAFRPARAISPG